MKRVPVFVRRNLRVAFSLMFCAIAAALTLFSLAVDVSPTGGPVLRTERLSFASRQRQPKRSQYLSANSNAAFLPANAPKFGHPISPALAELDSRNRLGST